MTLRDLVRVGCGIGALTAVGVTAQAASAASTTSRIDIQGFVPVICWSQVSNPVATLENGDADFGAVQQFCNSGRGYTFLVQHAPGLQGAFIVDGRAVPASPSGTTVLDRSDAPVHRTIRLQVEGMAPGVAPSLSLSMVANG